MVLMYDNISIMVDMFKALAENNRFQIIELLSEKSLCVCEIETKLNMSQNLVSHHISVLKKAGLVENCRCGKNNFYSLNKQSINKIAKIIIKLGE
jgi:ArsR family transcriptional regulator